MDSTDELIELQELKYMNALVEKRNVVNEMRNTDMTLEQLRFFTIYLARINPRDPDTKRVRLSLKEFRAIMGISNTDPKHIDSVTDDLLKKIIKLPRGNKTGIIKFPLFNLCLLDKDEYGDYYVEFEAHPEAMPMLFDFKKEYFSYRLWNAVRLSSVNQIRMYEILKQYEKIGEREIAVTDLREMLGIKPSEYTRWDNFKKKVLDACQAALQEKTDISFTYGPGELGPRGVWKTIKFTIRKNHSLYEELLLKGLKIDGMDEETEAAEAAVTYTKLDARKRYAPSMRSLLNDEEKEGFDIVYGKFPGRFTVRAIRSIISDAIDSFPEYAETWEMWLEMVLSEVTAREEKENGKKYGEKYISTLLVGGLNYTTAKENMINGNTGGNGVSTISKEETMASQSKMKRLLEEIKNQD